MGDTIIGDERPTHAREQAIREIFLDRVWLGLVVVALTATPPSISRVIFTGWIPVYLIHLLFFIGAITGYLLRRRLSFRFRKNLTIVILDITAVPGMLAFGLMGAAWWWLLLASLLISILDGVRPGLIHTALAVLAFCLTGIAFTSGAITFAYDANQYITQYSSWITILAGPTLLTLFVFWAVGAYKESNASLLAEMENRRLQQAETIQQLEQTLAENTTLQGFIPICAHCKKIRDDQGFWENVEAYVERHADVHFTHALCPPCGLSLYGEVWSEAQARLAAKKAKTES